MEEMAGYGKEIHTVMIRFPQRADRQKGDGLVSPFSDIKINDNNY